MWKIAVGFVVFAALCVWLLSKSGDIDLSGEKHGIDVTPASTPAPAVVEPAASAASS